VPFDSRPWQVSRIVPVLDGPVTTPPSDTHTVVTECGLTDLKGKTLRVLTMLAHPRFREALEKAAREGDAR